MACAGFASVGMMGMAKVTIEVSEELAAVLLAAEKKLEEQAKAAKAFEPLDIGGTQQALREATTAVGQDLQRRWLQSLDTEEAHVVIGGKRCTKVGRYETTFRTLEGPVSVTRSLYRERGVRNGATMDVVSARVGAVEDGWVPEAAQAMAYLHQLAPSREAQALAQQLRRLPYSRSSFERLGHAVGSLHSVVRDRVEDELIETLKVPRKARVVSVSLDRVAVPMEEPHRSPVGRPMKGAARRPVTRVFRMAYCGTITLHELGGKALHTIRYGRMPKSDPRSLCESLTADLKQLLRKAPRLEVTLLTDGAPEMSQLLDAVINEKSIGRPVHRTPSSPVGPRPPPSSSGGSPPCSTSPMPGSASCAVGGTPGLSTSPSVMRGRSTTPSRTWRTTPTASTTPALASRPSPSTADTSRRRASPWLACG